MKFFCACSKVFTSFAAMDLHHEKTGHKYAREGDPWPKEKVKADPWRNPGEGSSGKPARRKK